MNDVDAAKQSIRERIWHQLDQACAVPAPGAHGRIPSFEGAHLAADRLSKHDAWIAATVVKANPDKAQFGVRIHALNTGKLLYMAVPRLAAANPFYLLSMDHLDAAAAEIATSEWAAQHAPTVDVTDMRPVDLIICGSVAVNREGVRIGKGAGYSDIEIGLLMQAGLVSSKTVIATTVHRLQVLDEPLPETAHDFRLDLIVTPDETIACKPSERPAGIIWDHLTASKIDSIPALGRARPEQ
jgi:5-formyltetrahydrofolate cyclo-ligase